MRWKARIVVVAAVVATAAGCGTSDPGSHAAAGHQQHASPASASAVPLHTHVAARLTAGQSAWVTVSVARLWQSPSAPWPVDAPALAAPVRVRTWLRAMTLSQRRALDVRSDTEALLGDRVVVVRLRRHWAKVVVPSQPSQKDARGYPGWVPRRQLTARHPASTDRVATVTARTTWLRSDDSAAGRVIEVSAGTRLPYVGSVGRFARVVTPRGELRRLATRKVAVHAPGAPAILPSRASVVSTAKSFLGEEYLWGGLSGFGIDCSGLTWLDYRLHGIRTPRDALPQSQHGQLVTTRRPGDLLFYASNGLVHHVSIYLGDGEMVHAPHTGSVVRIESFANQPLRSEYAGARRYLD